MLKKLQSYLLDFLQNPIWYLLVVAGLVLLISLDYLPWWLAGSVALIWGAWLVINPSDAAEQTRPASRGLVHLQGYIDQTLAYKAQIDRVIKSSSDPHNQFYIQQLGRQLETCGQAVTELVERLNYLRQDELIRNDLQTVPQAIADLEQRLAQTSNGSLAPQLNQLLRLRQNQHALLLQLQNSILQTEIQLEHTLSLLGTIYSQLLISQATNDIADYGRISASIDEEMHRLSDQLDSLREIRGLTWADPANSDTTAA